MQEKRLSITINKPLGEVWRFVLNPKDTPLWIDSIVTEGTNEWPVSLGSIYRNQNRKGEWSEYKVTEYKENERFTFSSTTWSYHV